MLFSPSLDILFSLYAVLFVRIENNKQSLCHVINKELKRPPCYSDDISENVLTSK